MTERTYFETQLRRWKRETQPIAGEARNRMFFRSRRDRLNTKRRRAEKRRERQIQETTKETKSDR